MSEAGKLLAELNRHRHLDSYKIAEALDIEYTFQSNRIEGNTLTLRETELVVNKGLTISGKSMKEHMEAINHADAIELIRNIASKNAVFNESRLLQIHNLVLRGIDPKHAGKYRNVQVYISGSGFTPPQPYLVQKEMENYFYWFETNKSVMHPVLLAAEAHERLVTIHPFIDGNGRTARLVMNMILLGSGYVIANIKGDSGSRLEYYRVLEKSQTSGNLQEFLEFIVSTEIECLKKYIKILKP